MDRYRRCLSASSLPATTCSLDSIGEVLGCSGTTIDVNVTWTGYGTISRGVSNNHFQSQWFIETDHFSGSSRDAIATGIVAGLTVSASDLAQAELGTATSGTTVVCIGSGC